MRLHATVRDTEVIVELSMAPAEPDVGIMSSYVDDYSVTSEETGEPLSWELTDDELNALAEQADEHAADEWAYYEELRAEARRELRWEARGDR